MSAVSPPLSEQAAAPARARAVRNVVPIMSGVLLVLLLSSLDRTIIATAMPRVIAQLNGYDRYAWVATAYLLTSTVTVPIYGKLSDLLGRKRILFLGLFIFLGGSALSGASQTMTQLILFRGLQGLGAGALLPVALALVGDIFPPKERGKWLGLTGSVWGLSAVIGPTLGGWITESLGWRWVFYVNLPLGLVVFAVLALVMPPLRGNAGRVRIDFIGALLFVAGVVPLLLAFTWAGSTFAWASVQTAGLLGGAVVILAAFALYEARYAEPILQPQLFRNRTFTVCVLGVAFTNAAMLGSIAFIPLFIQAIIGASATRSGAVLTPMMIMTIVGAVVAGQIISRTGRYRYTLMAGLAFTMLGYGLLLTLGAGARPGSALPALLVLGGGMGFTAGFNVVNQNAFPRKQLGQVTSALAFFRSIGGTLGVAVAGSLQAGRYFALYHAGLPAPLRHGAAAHAWNLRDPQVLLQPRARAAMARAYGHLGPRGPHLYTLALGFMKSALTDALHQVFILGLLCSAATFVLVLFFLPQVKLRGREAASPDEEVGARQPAMMF